MDETPPLLILDLDETLIHASDTVLERDPDFVLFSYHVYLRPHLDQFLNFAVKHFRVAIWTAASSDYAAAAVRRLPIDNLEFVWARNRCTRRYDLETREQYWVKDLKKVRRKGYPLERVLAVDDTARKFERSYGNLILIRAFEGSRSDRELLLLAEYLGQLRPLPDYRRVEKRGWRARLTRSFPDGGV